MKILSKVASAMILSTGLLMASSYSVDNAHSNVGFTVKHMMVTNVHGKFTSYDAKVEFDDATKTFKKLVANINTNSIETGNLTIRGITKPVVLEVEDIAILGDKVGFSLEGKINRQDFDLKWNKAIELGGVAVSDEVKIKVDIEAKKQ